MGGLPVSRRPSLVFRNAEAVYFSSPAFCRIVSISSDASALVRSSLGRGLWACSARVLREDSWAPVIGASPETQSFGSFWVLPAVLPAILLSVTAISPFQAQCRLMLFVPYLFVAGL